MASKDKVQSCCASEVKTCCKVEAVVGVDERGQIVLPKDLREKAGIHAGDKLSITSWEKDGKICCFSLSKVEDLTKMVKATLGPIMKEILE
jgi:antitoxin PrlF